ncbi:hypothetical protein EOI86_19760 [Hwanghaeella grinnelliae]|uniref:Lipoprotein n=1 Tax=Hwanghaeella grinnelliae TaxID=2500179 RepID=A0A437QKN4_9PROT|nr:hypothetical protein [Hwanghaeella grinnelliae]RVU35065.1 hypothetical protein EOI86_19760 [Hwanghaeella grinnelliae]
MTGFRISKGLVAAIAAGFLSIVALAGCDDAPNEPESTAAQKTPELSPGASAESLKAKKQAQLALEIEPHGYLFIEGRHRFTQTRHFTESAGVGVTLTRGKVCVSSGKECVEAEVTYRVDAGKKLSLQQHYVATEALPDDAVVEYWGVDDNGNPVSVKTDIHLEIPKQDIRE